MLKVSLLVPATTVKTLSQEVEGEFMNVDGHSTVITPALPYILSLKSKIGGS